jgi:single-stranded-DNA-specific exonuclease
LSRYRWKLLPILPRDRLNWTFGVSPLLVQLLHNRGISDPNQYEMFLAADERLSFDPFLLPDIQLAVNRISHAIISGEEIAVYGDFDVDGVTATVLLVEGLSLLGGKVRPYIPHRLEEGYGLNCAALEDLHRQGVRLVITADCGITAVAEVERAREIGLDIIVTDHHSVLQCLPPALANIDPKCSDSLYPCEYLAGVGVAFKLLQALFSHAGKKIPMESFLELMALGTVADVVPLMGENRYFTRRGLELIANTKRPGILAMMSQAGLKRDSLGADDIAWSLGPRLNASGRLEHAMLSYKLLTAASTEEGLRLAVELEQMNTRRQKLTEEVLDLAHQKVQPVEPGCHLLMAGGDFHAGIVGIVAGRLVDEFYRPAIVLELGQKVSRGSGRSIPEFDLVEALRECQDLLTRFGGHSLAAGFTLPTSKVDSLRQRLKEIAKAKLSGFDLRPQLTIDAPLSLTKLNGQTYQSIQQLAPFGEGNPPPIFISKRVQVTDFRRLGEHGDHLELKLRVDKTSWRGIGFGLGSMAEEITPLLDIVYNLTVNNWREQSLLQLSILDFTPSG